MGDSVLPVLMFLGFAAVLALGVYGYLQEQKRREALRLLAEKLGMRYRSGKDKSLPQRYDYLAQLDNGSNRYAENIFTGTWDGRSVTFFDYHYETYSTDSKGKRTTHHHYYRVYLCALERSFPELRIYPENILSKIGQAMGYADIDFESVEFSKAFTVRSADKKFAYDICHGQMMELLLRDRDATVEIEGDTLALIKSGRLQPADLEANLARLVGMRELIPKYLFDE